MDYEKKYKNALTIAQSRFKIEKDESVLTCLGMMFPELRESEDERIRRAIIELLKEVEEDETYTGRQHIPDMLAYLEKQKVLTEHKEGIYYYHRDGTFTFISHPAVENPHNFTVPKPNEKPVDYDHEMWKNCEANFEGGKKEVIDHPEKYGLQKEQNHDGKKWIYEDEYHKDMERCFNDGKDEVLENPEKYGLFKVAEWSEEDKNMWTHLNGYLNGFSCSENAIKQMADWFYELPNRFNLQPWKPSEEQMEELWNVISYIEKPSSNFLGVPVLLESLYEDLKQL